MLLTKSGITVKGTRKYPQPSNFLPPARLLKFYKYSRKLYFWKLIYNSPEAISTNCEDLYIQQSWYSPGLSPETEKARLQKVLGKLLVQ